MRRQSVRLASECERMGKRTFDHATLAFVTAYLLVLAYLFSFYGGQLPLVFFWAPMLAAISLVAWQCTMVESDKWRTGLVLSEVLAIGFLAHMLFVIPAGRAADRVFLFSFFARLNFFSTTRNWQWDSDKE